MDGSHLPMLVKEAVALIALRNTGAGRSLSPKVADFWIPRAPGRMLELQLYQKFNDNQHKFFCVILLPGSTQAVIPRDQGCHLSHSNL